MKMEVEEIVFEPQPGPQTEFLKNSADIIFYGGAAGSGKTYALLLETLSCYDIKGFNCAIFRKNSTQIRSPGGLWANSHSIFRYFGGVAREAPLEWTFPSGAVIKFAHIDHENDVYAWQGSQICLICFDELTHFSRSQFFYMLSRNRSTCGIRPYVRATTNPDADSWVRQFIDWWIDPDTGLAIENRSGVIRWFIIVNDSVVWADSKEELAISNPDIPPKSFTFINASIYDNQKLLKSDPNYLSNLHALSRVERERLLHGNWNVRPSGGLYFKRQYFEVVQSVPKKTKKVRYWDRAATMKTETNDPDFTVGLLLEKDQDNILYVTNIIRLRESPLGVLNAIRNTALQDGYTTRIGIEQDPGQAGVSEVDYLIRKLQGFMVTPYKATKDKITRALPASSQCEAGNIKVLRANWNEDFFNELENFPEATHDDIVDALSGAFLMHTEKKYDLNALVNM